MVPDDARLRLQTLAAPPLPDPQPDPRWWPAAPDGTPGARLRMAPDLPDVPDDDGGRAVPAVAGRSAWDEPRTGLGRWLPASWLAARWDPGG
ncbi:MAG TPA: hypothetical protein VGH76_09490, partial [Actinomycetospora sp.]|uniref:hypothetical protein n=1 Tax=Actinomycetospora sp. TaxID=1872135 RepID=UPI002F3F3D55